MNICCLGSALEMVEEVSSQDFHFPKDASWHCDARVWQEGEGRTL